MRLLELQSGSIELDGIDISQVSVDLLRERCFVTLSQDPLLLSNETVRFNLDPDSSASDETIVSALTKTGLWAHFRSSQVGEAALDRQLAMFPEMSVGQTQLFALSRALVKAATLRRDAGTLPVVLLDEPTSALDAVTEAAIYRIIDEELTARGHTVIIVAHRLGVLRWYMKRGRDTVVEMVNGRFSPVDFE